MKMSISGILCLQDQNIGNIGSILYIILCIKYLKIWFDLWNTNTHGISWYLEPRYYVFPTCVNSWITVYDSSDNLPTGLVFKKWNLYSPVTA